MRKFNKLFKLIKNTLLILLLFYVFLKVKYIFKETNILTREIISEFNIREYGFEKKLKDVEYIKKEEKKDEIEKILEENIKTANEKIEKGKK